MERALGPVLGQVPLQGRGGVRWPTRSVREWGPFLRPAVLVPVPRSSPRPPRLQIIIRTFVQHFHIPAPLCLEGSKSLALSIFTLAKPYSSFKSSSDVISSVKPSLALTPSELWGLLGLKLSPHRIH